MGLGLPFPEGSRPEKIRVYAVPVEDWGESEGDRDFQEPGEVENEGSSEIPAVWPEFMFVVFLSEPPPPQNSAYLTTLHDVLTSWQEERDRLSEAVLRGILTDSPLPDLSPAQRIAVLLLLAEQFGAAEAQTDAVSFAAHRALGEARSLSAATAETLAEVSFRAGRLLAYRGDAEQRRQGMAVLEAAMSQAGPELRRRMAAASGLARMAAYAESKEPADLEEAVAACRTALAEAPPGSPGRREHQVDLAALLTLRSRGSGTRADLVEALELLSEALGLAPGTRGGPPQDDPRTGDWHNLLLDAVGELLRRASGHADADRTVGLLDSLLSGPVEPALGSRARFALAYALDLRWHGGGELADLRRSRDLLTELHDAGPADGPPWPILLATLAMVGFRYAQATGDEQGLDRALALLDEAIPQAADDPDSTAGWLRDKAVLLEARALRDGGTADLDTAVDLLERAARNPRTASTALINLGFVLLTRYRQTRRTADLDRAIDELDAAAAMADEPEDRIHALQALHHAVGVRHAALGALGDLERMRDLALEARSAAAETPELRATVSRYLAEALDTRFSATGDRSALNEAIAVLEEQLADDATQDRTREELALALWKRYHGDGDCRQLSRAIALLDATLARQPAHSFARAQVLGLLGLFRRDRYINRGDGADLDTAIEHLTEALAYLTATDDKYAEVATNYGLALRDRYGRDGNLYDLDRAIAVIDMVLDGPTGGGAAPVIGLNILGVVLRDRYHIASDPRDLHRAVAVYERAMASPSIADTLFPGGVLNNYGGALMDHYRHTHDLMDLTRCIDAFDRSVDAAPPGSPDRPRYLLNLSGGLSLRYERLHDIEDINRAVRLLDEALDAASDGWVNRSSLLMALGMTLRTRYRQLGRRGDRARAVESYRKGCTFGLRTQAGQTLIAAREWAIWLFEEGAWSEAVAAFRIALQAMTAVYEAQFGRRHKESWLLAGQGLSAHAAYAMAMEGASEEAVVALERGRALQLSEVLERDRAQLDDLVADGHGDAVHRYQNANREWAERIRAWEAAGEGLTGGAAPTTINDERLRAARSDLDASIAAIRRIKPEFLDAPEFDDIATAATTAPLVYLAATDAGGLALIVSPRDGSVDTVWLPGLTEQAVTLRVHDQREAHDGRRRDPGTWRGTLDAVTAWLWDVAMRNVVDRLGSGTSGVLIPVGPLGLLPLHAAWTPDASCPTKRRYAVDECVLSYAPNARSLRTAQEIADRVPMASLLTVRDPLPSEQQPLVFAAVETAAARARFEACRELCHTDARVREVTEALGRHEVHHFACHGVANLSEPLHSALILAEDQPLTLSDLLRLRLTGDGSGGVRLAILSSCESQVPGLALPDEAVSLPTGLLQAGVAGITATQWAVRDLASCLLMTRFHTDLNRPGATPSAALRTAQRWVRDTTNEQKVRDLREDVESPLPPAVVRALWRALIRRPLEERSFSHPADWAAFSHVGL